MEKLIYRVNWILLLILSCKLACLIIRIAWQKKLYVVPVGVKFEIFERHVPPKRRWCCSITCGANTKHAQQRYL